MDARNIRFAYALPLEPLDAAGVSFSRAQGADIKTIARQRMAERRIVEEGGKYYVYSEDGKKKLGGPYDSREEADKRLAQVEYHKHKDEGRGLWTIRDAGGRDVAQYADEGVADLSLDLLLTPRAPWSLERAWAEAHAARAIADERRLEDLIARVELERFGRV